MKFSLAATSALLLTTLATLARADEYADAMEEWCHGVFLFSIVSIMDYF